MLTAEDPGATACARRRSSLSVWERFGFPGDCSWSKWGSIDVARWEKRKANATGRDPSPKDPKTR
jgi:hypothetical protein